MFTKYCHKLFIQGLTCIHRTNDGRCIAGFLCECKHRKSYPIRPFNNFDTLRGEENK